MSRSIWRRPRLHIFSLETKSGLETTSSDNHKIYN